MMRINEAFKTQPAIDVVQVECRQVAGHRIELYLALLSSVLPNILFATHSSSIVVKAGQDFSLNKAQNDL